MEAGKKSTQFKDTPEWMLSKEAFSFIRKQFGQSYIDLFSTRANKYISWKPDKDSIATDAFSVTWEKYFPPFSLIWQVLTKIKKDQANTILIIPLWATQGWFPAVLKLIVATPIIINSCHLQLPGTEQKHPLYPQLKLVAFHLPKDTSRHINFLSQHGRS